jgi:hypothetical protein
LVKNLQQHNFLKIKHKTLIKKKYNFLRKTHIILDFISIIILFFLYVNFFNTKIENQNTSSNNIPEFYINFNVFLRFAYIMYFINKFIAWIITIFDDSDEINDELKQQFNISSNEKYKFDAFDLNIFFLILLLRKNKLNK